MRSLTDHVLPNIAPVFIVQLSLSAGVAVLSEAGLIRTTVRGRQHWHELAGARLSEVEHWIHTLVQRWAAAPTLTDPAVPRRATAASARHTSGS